VYVDQFSIDTFCICILAVNTLPGHISTAESKQQNFTIVESKQHEMLCQSSPFPDRKKNKTENGHNSLLSSILEVTSIFKIQFIYSFPPNFQLSEKIY